MFLRYVDLRLDWQTFEMKQNDDKLLDLIMTIGEAFPVVDEDGKEVEESQQDENDLTKLIKIRIQEHEGIRSETMFTIAPKQTVCTHT